MSTKKYSLWMPTMDGSVTSYTVGRTPAPSWREAPTSNIRGRVAYAAAHVVADPKGPNAPGEPAHLDWEATLGFRYYLWRQGLGVAEAMDTAQRGMGLDWATTAELIRRSAAAAAEVDGALVAGAGTDHAEATLSDLESVICAYAEQLEVVEDAGATPVLMASHQLARLARSPQDYATVYGRLLPQVRAPVILHWLGPAFAPGLAGYWGHNTEAEALDTVVALITEYATNIDGIKVSLLDAELEVALRERLPLGVRLYTGDDFAYPTLIKGTQSSHSDALLGVFSAIAPAAAAALRALDAGDVATYDSILEPTVPLARHLFAAPTYHYKTGISFLAWLNGHQPGFTMVGGLQSARSLPHLCQALRLADEAGVLNDPDLATRRMRHLLEAAGVSQ